MVATDIAARGLDVDSISHVINFDMPDATDAYIHRIGRAGRAKRTGDAFTLVTPDDDDMIRKLEKIMEHKLERQTIKGFTTRLLLRRGPPLRRARQKVPQPHKHAMLNLVICAGSMHRPAINFKTDTKC